MVKVGDKVVVVSAMEDDGARVGDVLTVSDLPHGMGFGAKNLDGFRYYVKIEGVLSASTIIVRPYTESEAEKRGAKFGVTGIYNPTGQRTVVVSTDKVTTPDPWPEKERWIVCLDGSLSTHEVYAENIRLDHEPEYVAWAAAPEHLRYDANRVYFDGKPVKWIAKPEGASVSVVYIGYDGWVRNGGIALTVKL